MPDTPEPAAPRDPDDLLTAEEVAAAHGVTVNAIYTARSRGTMPPPDRRFGRALVWRWATVEGLEFRTRVIGRPQA